MTDRKYADICIVGGAGHVGLPMALSFASAGSRVQIYDINEETLATIAAGKMPFVDDGADEYLRHALDNDRLTLTSDPADITPTGVLVITIGTPVDEFLNPSHGEVKSAIDTLLPYITDEHLIVLRSTLYPGTTDWLHRYLEDCGRKTRVSFCPERSVQGRAIKELAELPQIVSGTSAAAITEAKQFFMPVVPEIVELPPLEAEFVKLFDNSYRYIEFAIANQFFMVADQAGADYSKVHFGMTYGYDRARHMPRPGFTAGPCLFKDTMQIAAFARNQFSLGNSAMLVNEGLVLYVIEKIAAKFDLANVTVGLLGMAFKAESDDIRASLSYKMKKHLMMRAKNVLTTDPYVLNDPALSPLDGVIEQSDVLVVCAPHSDYRGMDVKGKPVFDVWNHITKPISADVTKGMA
ncbi:MAG: nucleotide sugar dehydrogenase [Rhodospirillales bacterium]|nr:nucleotide sugar dehydrogenase [Rhodospirillales bacterium]MBO6787677.1 nucleotide sugar dehydrogenase [Rhodospirillales bacterium]